MKWIAIIARTILGLLYLMTVVMFFFQLMPNTPMPGDAGNFASALMNSGFMTVVKVIEGIGAVLLLSGQYVRFAALWILPITIAILLFHVLMVPGQFIIPAVMLLLNLFLFYYYRQDFKVILKR